MEVKGKAVKIDVESYNKLKARKERTGINIMFQIHEAIKDYLKKHEV